MAICSACGSENRDGAKFCNECAAPLVSATPTHELEERKVVSVLFCDLVGFTAASDRQDPEDVRARIRPYHARLREEIERYGGTVEKFVGDAVMAVFGAPAAHEDDAERAVRAGLRILEAIDDLNMGDPDLDLKVRVGIDTGEAVVAVAARPEQGEGIVTGDVVNTASRIQAVAPVNGVAVADSTYRATSRIFEFEPLTAASVKGKTDPVRLWRAKAARSRFGSDITRLFTAPLVGRELEKALLVGTFERAVQQRSVQLVTIVGEPGVGKSRMIAELSGYTDAKPGIFRWRQGRCLPYGEGITFWALGEIVKAEAGILESDSAEVAEAKLDAVVSPEDSEYEWLLGRLAPLVGAEADSGFEREELFAAWRRFLEGLAASRPSVIVFEDLHWADEALLVFLEYLAEWSQGVPLLILCAARPELYERRSGWGAGQRNAHTINLSPLSDQETAELVSHLTSRADLGPELEQAIVERAEGNPLYAEELVRLLADRALGPGEQTPTEVALPESVQALIAARLDTLSPDRKSLLQDAAVVGKVFWASAVAEIGGRDSSEVEVSLHELGRKELVRPARSSSMEGEREYAFWHLLVRDVAYAQIPRPERARRHRSAALWIERKAGARVEDMAEVLAHHYMQALELAKAAGDADQIEQLAAPARRFFTLAGERALGLDTVQAEARLAQALRLTPENDPERPDVLARWAEAVFQAGRPLEAADALDQALPSLRASGDAEATAQALQLRSRAAFRIGEGRHVEFAAEAVELLEKAPPGPAIVAAYTQLANARFLSGTYADAIEASDRARTFAESLGEPGPARALGYRGFARANLGDPRGLDEMERALAQLVERGAGRDVAILQNNLALARYPFQGPARSLAAFDEGITFCKQRGLGEGAALLEANVPLLLAELGRPEEAIERASRLATLYDSIGDGHALSEVRAVNLASRLACGEPMAAAEREWLIEAGRASGAIDIVVLTLATAAAGSASVEPTRARDLLDELEQVPGARGTPYYARQVPAMVRTALRADDTALAARLADRVEPRYPLEEHALCAARAQLAEAAGDRSTATTLYADAARRWKEFGNVPERAHALLGQGRCLNALGRPEGEEPLGEARDLFASMGYLPVLAETEALIEQAAAHTSQRHGEITAPPS
jgi:class 3 adenylate cyclase/tetratricopeptide (TPR) repeat protein